MDAFGFSICKGLASKKPSLDQCLLVGLWFGGFQALMPLIGFLLGAQFESLIASIDHWITFILLFFIGANMIRESLQEDTQAMDASFSAASMGILAVATSIDALAVGVTFAFLRVTIFPAVALIGLTTFVLCAVGVKIGSICGERYQKPAAIAGGVILMGLGTKILLEHLGILT